MFPLVLALLLALALSALSTTAELAIFSLGESRVRTLVEEGFGGSEALARVRTRPKRLVALLRTANAFGDVALAGLAAYAGYTIGGAYGLGVAILLAFFTLLFVGRLIPMSVVDDHIMRIALAFSPTLETVARVLAPILRPIEGMVRVMPEQPTQAADVLTESEVRQITSIGQVEGVIGEQERQLIERAFRLDETKAWDIMTPRVDIFAWREDRSLAAIASQFHNVPYSRVPIYRETVDDITGVLYLRDAYQALVSGQRDVPLRDLAREPLTVPGSVPLTKLLRDFQTRRIHLAIVVDEYGGTDGLVTLEDVIEELVGEIVDETDIARESILRASRNEIVAAGDADLREINHVFNTAFPLLEHRSLNGYLLDELGRVPDPGERIERDGVAIEVIDATETQVVRARLRRLPTRPEAGRPAASEAAAGDGRRREGRDRPERAADDGRTPSEQAADRDGEGETHASDSESDSSPPEIRA